MRFMPPTLLTLLLLAAAMPQLGWSNHSPAPALPFAVNRIMPAIDISAAQLSEANALLDIHERYPSSWIKEYVSVEVLTVHQGEPRKATSTSDVLTAAQKDLMVKADAGTDINVTVHYMPENNLSQNDVKEIAFAVSVRPDKEASFSGGQERMHQYLEQRVIDRIPEGTFEGFDFAAITFTVSENGGIDDVRVVESSRNDQVDAQLVETISNMPRWSPAAYADGTQVKQSFALTVGNMENCMIHTLNILPK